MHNERLNFILKQKELFGNYVFKPDFIKKYSDFYNEFANYITSNNLGDLTHQEQLSCFIFNIDHVPLCECCGNKTLFKSTLKGFRRFCSKECNSKCNTPIKNFRKKYGLESPMHNDLIKEKVKNTTLKKYGVDNVFKSDKIKDKIKEINIQKYGVDNPAKSDLIKEKTKQNNIKKYGVKTPSMLYHVKNKTKKTNKEKYGNEYFTKSNFYLNKKKEYDIKNFIENLPNNLNFIHMDDVCCYSLKCNKCNNIFSINRTTYRSRLNSGVDVCLHCNKIDIKDSFSQNDLLSFICENNFKVDKNVRNIIPPQEIDIFIPEKNIGIEYNGLYWHSDQYKDKYYHRNKWELCNNIGVNLITIFEDEWLYKKDIVKSIIKSRLGLFEEVIYARKCIIKELTSNELKNFLEINHIQGHVNAKIKYGLYFNNEIVSVMSFGSLRKSLGSKKEDGCYEMLRFCSKLNAKVVGGASKLLKHFIKIHNPKKIISYSDNRWFDGKLYENIGFKLHSISDVNYYYIVGLTRENRFKYRKDVLVKQGFDPNKTESQIMLERGIPKIWDCGNKKWELTF